MSNVLITLTARRKEQTAIVTMEVTEAGNALVDLGGLGLDSVNVAWGAGKWNSRFWDFAIGSETPTATILIRGDDRAHSTFLTRRDPQDEALSHFRRIRDVSGREWKLLEGNFPDAEQLRFPGTVAIGEKGLLFLEEDASGTQVRVWGKRQPVPNQPPVPPLEPGPQWQREVTIQTSKRTFRLTGDGANIVCDAGGAFLHKSFYVHDAKPGTWNASYSDNGLHLSLPPGALIRNAVLHCKGNHDRASVFFKRIREDKEFFSHEWALESGNFPGPGEVMLHGDAICREKGLCTFVERMDGQEVRRWREVSYDERLPDFDR